MGTMNRKFQFILLPGLLVLFASSSLASAEPALTAFPGLPLFFEANNAQAPSQFLARTRNAQFLVAPSGLQIAITTMAAPDADAPLRRDSLLPRATGMTHLARVSFIGADPCATIVPASPLSAKINYLTGNDRAQWRPGLPTWAQVKVNGLYPGIDLVYYGNQRQLEYDFTVAPGVSPAAIALKFEGLDQLSIDREGGLVLRFGGGKMRQHPPRLYQIVEGVRREIQGGYRVKDERTVAFAVTGPYDHHRALIIDPIFEYSTFFGGNGNDLPTAIKVDINGNIYVAGETASSQFPFAVPTNAFQRTFKGTTGRRDAFVAKLSSQGNQLLYFTYLGSTGDDGALDLAIDSAGNAYVTGFTDAADFPVQNAVFPKIAGTIDPTLGVYHNDAFVTELNTNGSALVFSTYLGGDFNDLGSGIALDPAGYVYVTGYTHSTNFPATSNAFQRSFAGIEDVFVAKFAPGGSPLVYATFLGGTNTDEGDGIVADAQGCAYVTGSTLSTGFPLTTNASRTNSSNFEAFVTKLGPYGSNLLYSTFLGGTNADYGYRITLDSLNNAYVTGTSSSPDFPNTPVYGLTSGTTSNSLNYDAFLARLDSSGRLVFSTLFGGGNTDAGWDLAVDPDGRAFVVGITSSTNFPVFDPFGLFATTNSGGRDVFVTAFNTNGLAVRYSGYLGGKGNDFGYGIAVDAESSAYITGLTYSTNFPTTIAPFQSVPWGAAEGFLAKIRLLDPTLTALRSGSDLVLRWPATAPDYVLQAASALVPPLLWTTVSQTPSLAQGFYTVTLGPTNDFSFFRLERR